MLVSERVTSPGLILQVPPKKKLELQKHLRFSAPFKKEVDLSSR